MLRGVVILAGLAVLALGAAWLADPLRWRAIGRIGEEAMAHRAYNGPTCKGIQRADM